MPDWVRLKGWARHSMFGLRAVWLEEYLRDPSSPARLLGNRQVDSLEAWLRTGGLCYREGEPTLLASRFAASGVEDMCLWEMLWVNVVFSFPTARWYVSQGNGEFTLADLRRNLSLDVPRISDRTVYNAIEELAGLLDRTPVGDRLCQGKIVSRRPRHICRTGIEPNDEALRLSMVNLLSEIESDTVQWEEDLLWPWVVFGSKREKLIGRLLTIDCPQFRAQESGVLRTNKGC